MQQRLKPPPRPHKFRKLTWANLQRLRVGKRATDKEIRGLSFVRLPSGNLQGQYRYTDPVTGKQVTLSLGRVHTEEELIARGGGLFPFEAELDRFRDMARELRLRKRAGLDVASGANPSELTVAGLCELQLREGETKGASPATLRTYKYAHKHLEPIAKVPLRSLRSEHLADIHRKVGKHHPAMANMMLQVFSAAWAIAKARDDSLPTFPGNAKAIARFKLDDSGEGMTLEQLKAWCAILPSVDEFRRSIWTLGALSALRSEDLRSIKVSDIHLDGAYLHIPKPKGGKPFDLPLSGAALNIVKRQLSKVKGSAYLWPSPVKATAYVSRGAIVPRTKDGFGFHWHPHSLRHAWGRAATAAGVHPYLHKLLFNHALDRGDVTAGYVKVDLETLRKAQEQVTAWLREEAGLQC